MFRSDEDNEKVDYIALLKKFNSVVILVHIPLIDNEINQRSDNNYSRRIGANGNIFY